MEHQHGLHKTHKGEKNIKIAFFLNLGFTIIEIIGGFFTNSVAILSDAMHDLGDSLSLGLAWYFQRISEKETNLTFTYGYRRFTVIGALINSIVLIIGCVFILQEAIPRIMNPEVSDATGMIGLAIFGIIVNGYAAFRLNQGDTLNEKVVSLHLLEDVLGWVGVLIGAILMYFFQWEFIDPLLSILISLFILFNIYRNLKSTFDIFLQSTPQNVDAQSVNEMLLSFSQVAQYHDLHMWTLDGQFNILSVHIKLSLPLSFEQIALLKKEIRTALQSLNLHHCTIEVDYPEIDCDFEESIH